MMELLLNQLNMDTEFKYLLMETSTKDNINLEDFMEKVNIFG